jgi:hypothetical protein
MFEPLLKPTRADWRLWALGAALLTAGVALLLARRNRSAGPDPYDEWWRRREELRANGGHSPRLYPHLFI